MSIGRKDNWKVSLIGGQSCLGRSIHLEGNPIRLLSIYFDLSVIYRSLISNQYQLLTGFYFKNTLKYSSITVNACIYHTFWNKCSFQEDEKSTLYLNMINSVCFCFHVIWLDGHLYQSTISQQTKYKQNKQMNPSMWSLILFTCTTHIIHHKDNKVINLCQK